MNTTKLASLILTGILMLGAATTASADSMTFKPVKSAKQAAALKVGTSIAVSCGNCNGVSVLTVDSKRSYLQDVKCPLCKTSFVQAPGSGGRDGFVYSDRTGHTAHLSAR